MKCPNCNEEITEVYVVSECYQVGHLGTDWQNGLVYITDYAGLPVVENTLRMECLYCGVIIKGIPDTNLPTDEEIARCQNIQNKWDKKKGDEPI